MRNPHLPSINGYVKSKDGPKSQAITSYNGITSESATTKGTKSMLIKPLINKPHVSMRLFSNITVKPKLAQEPLDERVADVNLVYLRLRKGIMKINKECLYCQGT